LCVTWAGGAEAVSKTNWKSLLGRQVVIWPDNDPAGFKASEDICSILRQVGVKSLEVVHTDILARELPLKWDLADPLPVGKNESFIRDMILRAQQKAVNPNHFFTMLGLGKELSAIDRLQAREVLWRVEERLRPLLEEKRTKPWEINDLI